MKMKAAKYLFVMLFTCSCAGTHGSIQRYEFETSKAKLEKAVSSILATSNTIILDTVKRQYNDGLSYFTIFVTSGADKYGYVLRYYGDENYWKTSETAQIFICYARINGKGGKEGDEQLTEERKGKLLKVFKDSFIDLVSQKLNSKPLIYY